MDNDTLLARVKDQLDVFIQESGTKEARSGIKRALFTLIGTLKKIYKDEIKELMGEIDKTDFDLRRNSTRATPEVISLLFKMERLKGKIDGVSDIQTKF